MQLMRKIPTSITLDPELIDRIDQAAESLERSRSWVARVAFEQYLSSSLPPGGASSATLPGTPAIAVGGSARTPDSTSFTQEILMTATDPYKEMKEADVSRVRRFQEQAGENQCTNQDRRNNEANSPDQADR